MPPLRRETAWSEFEEPCLIHGPGQAEFFMGAQVGWNPQRESQPELGCRECGGIVVFCLSDECAAISIPFKYDALVHALVLPEHDPLTRRSGICAGCMRWVHDHKLDVWIEDEYLRRGTNEPIEVVVPVGGTIPIPVKHCEAWHKEQERAKKPAKVGA